MFVVYEKLDENYGRPLRLFSTREGLDDFLKNNRDSVGGKYCYEELEVDE